MDNFLEYVNKIVRKGNYIGNLYNDHFIPQYKFICDDNHIVKVDKLFNFDRYEEVDEFLLEKFGVTDKKIYLKGGYKKNDIILMDIQKEKIYEIYKKDFEIFGYDK